MWPLCGQSVRYQSTNTANSASHPSGVGKMSSNPLMMDYEGGDLTAVRCCLCRWSSRRTQPVCAGCGRWPQRPGGPDQWRERIRGVHTRRCAIQIDAFFTFTTDPRSGGPRPMTRWPTVSCNKPVGDWISAPSPTFVAMATRVAWFHWIGHPRKPPGRPKHLRSICHTSRLIGDFVQILGSKFWALGGLNQKSKKKVL